jgi:hypothetical protein
MSIPSVEAQGQDARHAGAPTLTSSRGVLDAPAVAGQIATAILGDLSRT